MRYASFAGAAWMAAGILVASCTISALVAFSNSSNRWASAALVFVFVAPTIAASVLLIAEPALYFLRRSFHVALAVRIAVVALSVANGGAVLLWVLMFSGTLTPADETLNMHYTARFFAVGGVLGTVVGLVQYGVRRIT